MQSKRWAIWSAFVGILGGGIFNGISRGITRSRNRSKWPGV